MSKQVAVLVRLTPYLFRMIGRAARAHRVSRQRFVTRALFAHADAALHEGVTWERDEYEARDRRARKAGVR